MRSHRGFTLIELLVVLMILGILIALLTPALAEAIRRTYDATQLTELNLMATALASFKEKHGEFPPSRIVISETGDYSQAYFKSKLSAQGAQDAIALTTRSIAYLKKIFPRTNFSFFGPVTTIPNGYYDFNGDGKVSDPVILSGDECLVYFLGGIANKTNAGYELTGFSRNPVNPFQNSYVSVNRSVPFFQFDVGRLIDENNNGFPSYKDKLSANNSVLAYFVSYNGEYDPDDVNFSGDICGFSSSACATPTKGPGRTASAGPNPYTMTTSYDVKTKTTWIRPDSYQIIIAGRNGEFGIGGLFIEDANQPLPFNPVLNEQFTGDLLNDQVRNVELDNITSFSGNQLGR